MIERIAHQWHRRPGATLDVIRQAEASTHTHFPQDYLAFLVWSNGGEGYIGTSYLSLWQVEEVYQLNLDYQIAKYLPDFLAIGTDGGGECYALNFTVNPNEPSLVRVPLGDLDPGSGVLIGANFREGIEHLLSA